MKIINLIVIVVIITLQSSYAQKAGNFTKTDVDGNTYTLYDELEKGKPVLLDFMATFCANCQEYVPALEQMHQDYGQGSLAWVWAFDTFDNETEQQIKDYKTTLNATYPAFAKCSSLGEDYNVIGIPTFIVVCPNKSITYNRVGWTDDTEQEIIDALNSCNAWALGVNDNSKNKLSSTIYPNPTFQNPTLSFHVKKQSNVKIELFNILGEKQFTISDREETPGLQQIEITTSSLATGMYFINLTTNDGIQSLKLVVK